MEQVSRYWEATAELQKRSTRKTVDALYHEHKAAGAKIGRDTWRWAVDALVTEVDNMGRRPAQQPPSHGGTALPRGRRRDSRTAWPGCSASPFRGPGHDFAGRAGTVRSLRSRGGSDCAGPSPYRDGPLSPLHSRGKHRRTESERPRRTVARDGPTAAVGEKRRKPRVRNRKRTKQNMRENGKTEIFKL